MSGHVQLPPENERLATALPVVVGARIRRTANALKVTMRYDDIEPRANREWSVSLVLDIGDGHERHVAWSEYRYADSGEWNRSVSMSRTSPEAAFGVRCPWLRGVPDFEAETVTIRVPDKCFKGCPQRMPGGSW